MLGIVPAIADALDSTVPTGLLSRVAAVSVIIEGEASPSILLIKRAERVGDPWSGQVAFPGGKMAKEDESVVATASRETLEEVGIDLRRDARFLGYFGSFRTHTGVMDVVPTVFLLRRRVEVYPNGEVSAYRWVPIDVLASSEPALLAGTEAGAARGPAFMVKDFVVWGLTHRMIRTLLGRVGR